MELRTKTEIFQRTGEQQQIFLSPKLSEVLGTGPVAQHVITGMLEEGKIPPGIEQTSCGVYQIKGENTSPITVRSNEEVLRNHIKGHEEFFRRNPSTEENYSLSVVEPLKLSSEMEGILNQYSPNERTEIGKRIREGQFKGYIEQREGKYSLLEGQSELFESKCNSITKEVYHRENEFQMASQTSKVAVPIRENSESTTKIENVDGQVVGAESEETFYGLRVTSGTEQYFFVFKDEETRDNLSYSLNYLEQLRRDGEITEEIYLASFFNFMGGGLMACSDVYVASNRIESDLVSMDSNVRERYRLDEREKSDLFNEHIIAAGKYLKLDEEKKQKKRKV